MEDQQARHTEKLIAKNASRSFEEGERAFSSMILDTGGQLFMERTHTSRETNGKSRASRLSAVRDAIASSGQCHITRNSERSNLNYINGQMAEARFTVTALQDVWFTVHYRL